MASRALEERLEQLRVSYRAKLGEKLDALDASLRSALQEDSPGCGELWAVAHNLAGTAGSYGFKDLARAVREIEELVLPFRHGGKLPAPVSEGLVLLLAEARRLVTD